MEEQFRLDFVEKIQNIVSKEELQIIDGVLTLLFNKYEISNKKNEIIVYEGQNKKLITQFLAIKKLEGKSENTLKQYHDATYGLINDVHKNLCDMTTNDIRYHLVHYQQVRKVSNTTLDNKRRFLSSFFAWLTAEDFIRKNPMLLIKKIKEISTIKKPFSDYELEKIRDSINTKKEKAIIEFLLSTGCRVSEVSRLNLENIDFVKGECVVLGKGGKERKVYINDKAMYYLQGYLETRKDSNHALFLNKRNSRIRKGTIESMLHKIEIDSQVSNIHPHRFRRTFATNSVKRGIPISHVQKMMGHSTLDMTMHYCSIDDDNVRFHHKNLCVV